ncbi:hypothetical protein FLONG3_8555 [Fusarium longipes]|uniref:Uncharacterized protein n=1 Tax=Fusarium longipes TaxID=694270 RepID=A0A395S4G5_9HYPO|nr:hypothetical protein FLONG3_8555 [Fusarium longipes]
MDMFDSHENSSDSSISLASSVFTHDPNFPPYDSYALDSDAPDDDDDMDVDQNDYQHYGPPSYESLRMENATVRSDADLFSVTGWTTATVGSSAVSTSETRCPAPASVSSTASAAADLQVQEPWPLDSMTSPPSPISHVADYNFVVQDDQGLCGIGAWADVATSPFVAKRKRITPRQ